MNTIDFIKTMCADDGFYCGATIAEYCTNKFFNTAEGLAEFIDSHAEGINTYFAVGTFKSQERSRDSAKSFKAVFIDLDVGYKKPYATQTEAIDALKVFVKGVGLPAPTAIVNSGYGVQAFWALEQSLGLLDWERLHNKFYRLCVGFGLKVDTSVNNASRLMRAPNTQNMKLDTPADTGVIFTKTPVTIDALEAVFTAHDIHEVQPRRGYVVDETTSNLLNYKPAKFATIWVKSVDSGQCPQLQHIINEQESIEEPLWRAGLSVAATCTDADEYIHKMSEKHPQYSHEETVQKAELVAKKPYTCATFDSLNPNVCPHCPNWGKLTSPISLGVFTEAASPEQNIVSVTAVDGIEVVESDTMEIPVPPEPYFRPATGGVWIREKQSDGTTNDVMLYNHDLYVVQRIRDESSGEMIIIRAHFPFDGVRNVTVSLAQATSTDELRKAITSIGVVSFKMKEITVYIMNYVQFLQEQRAARNAFTQFGWYGKQADMFVVGRKVVLNGVIELTPPSHATTPYLAFFDTAGTLQGWQETMQYYRTLHERHGGMEAHMFMIGIAFGAVLMEFQPINAACFHMWSTKSGLGKTTGMLAGASIWGNPERLLLNERDTMNSKMHRAEVYRNIAVYMDEMTNTAGKDLSDFAYQLTSGMQRNRMGGKSNAERQRGVAWKTLFATTGNASIIDRIGQYKKLPKAEAMRILEHQVHSVSITKADADYLAEAVKRDYGHAGVVYVNYVQKHLAEVLALADETQASIDAECNLMAENRFWSALVSRTVTGLLVACKAGLIDWDVQQVRDWVISIVRSAREGNTGIDAMRIDDPEGAEHNDNGIDVTQVIADFMAENHAGILRIKSCDYEEATSHIMIPDATPRTNFIGRHEYDTDKLYLLPNALLAWCAKNQVSATAFFSELKNGKVKAKLTVMNIAKGTRIFMPEVQCIEINCKNLT